MILENLNYRKRINQLSNQKRNTMLRQIINNGLVSIFLIGVLVVPVKAQEIGNTSGTGQVGEYRGTENVVINHAIPPGCNNCNSIGGDYNFVGGTSSEVGTNGNLSSSISFGFNNSLTAPSGGIPAIGFGTSLDLNHADVYSMGNENTINASSAMALGNGVTIDGTESIGVGDNVDMDNQWNYAFGERVKVQAQRAMTIGFGEQTGSPYLINGIQNSITIGTKGQNQLNLNSNGHVSIGTNNSPRNAPVSKLEIRADGTSSSTSALDVQNSNSASLFYVQDDGFVGINTTSRIGGNPEIFQVNGSARAYAWNIYSDKRMKTDIQAIDNPIQKLLKVRGVTYQFIDGKYPKLNTPDGQQAGVIAQELKKVLPEAVTEPKNEKGLYGVNYDAIIPLLIETNKKQQKHIEKLDEKTKKIAQLEQKLHQQKAKNQELENRIEKLEALVMKDQQKLPKTGDNGQTLKGNRLYQNSPNPFSQETTIKYRLAEKVNNAKIVVANSNGNEKNIFNIKGSGYGEVTIRGGTLKPGNYVYSLIINGKQVKSRKMMLIRK